MLHSLPFQLKQTATDIWAFLKNPKDQPGIERGTPAKFRILLWVLLIDVLITIGLMGLLQVVKTLGWYTNENHAILEMLRTFPIWSFLLLGVLVIPLLEELVFRYGLRFKKGYISLVITVIALALGGLAIQSLALPAALGLTAALAMVLVLYFLNPNPVIRGLSKVWTSLYGFVFYAVALLFGLIHIANFTDFDYASAAVLLIPVLVAPQICAGLLMGYMRVKHGFFWGYFLHAGHNALFLGLGLAFMGDLQEKLNISNERYTLQVEEHMLLDPKATKSSLVGHDSIGFTNQQLDEMIVALLGKDKALVKFETSKRHYPAIDLRYKNHAATADMQQSKSEVLKQLQGLYKFEVSYRSQQMDAWDVTVADTAMLATHAVADIGTSTVMHNPEDIMFENATLGDLVRALEKDFKVMLIARRDLLESGKYNLTLPKGDFRQVQENLKTKYGILLQSRMELADLTVVSFKK